MKKVGCIKCKHQQRLLEPTFRKLRTYGHRIIRCSKCHNRIRLKGGEYFETDN